ncbi:septation ring formation regulator [Cytobacillus oceanisediminis]|jgi:septation ring formation regulator|uniref:Septation ring formation regulator EzrA n=1 Tax=Cytobacillus oceanisediminis TaxID=665099 RepID=A0A2V2ZR62_9BACI|nr:septation ring formation regulator EzrA [Cytobacillus oceanisediminis]PWW26139.1 septation ring formation regulator [Cytobacillus oceanisediminis]
MEYIIGGIVILICLYLTGLFLKKKHYKEIDRLETWKMEITDRPVLDEMSRVKKLNMTGQTEELFERWRNEWDEIVTTQLPDVEEYLFDAEENIDKYRFKKAQEIQQKIELRLTEIEESIKKLLGELNELVGSEEKNRAEIEELKDMYRECKKSLLAHRHTFGKAETILEKQLDEAMAKFEEFDEKTEKGNYLEARETLLMIKVLLEDAQSKMEAIPNLMVECQSKIPSQLDELKDGYKEMLEQGYILDHLQMDKEIERLEQEVTEYAGYVDKAETAEVQKGVEEIKDKIELLYDLLEKEVHARHYLSQQDEATRNMLYNNKDINSHLKAEMSVVRQSYHVSDKDLEVQVQLEKKLTQLFKKFEVLEHKINSQSAPHTVLREELAEVKEQLEEISDEQTAFAEKLQALRKDELSAREKVKELTKKVTETMRFISKSNVPGVSQEYKYLIQDAKESIDNVLAKLDEKPLNIPAVQQYLEVAVLTVDKAADSTNEMIETILLAEKVIQYGNRYRSRYPSIDKGLKEAESSFRSYEYKTALEQAAASIEEVEPGAIRKIEEIMKE